jgi:hypothetical protein
MSASLKSTLLALNAIQNRQRRNLDSADAPRVRFQLHVKRESSYRGAPALPGGAIDGNEWLRRAELIRAGQADLFGAE